MMLRDNFNSLENYQSNVDFNQNCISRDLKEYEDNITDVYKRQVNNIFISSVNVKKSVWSIMMLIIT